MASSALSPLHRGLFVPPFVDGGDAEPDMRDVGDGSNGLNRKRAEHTALGPSCRSTRTTGLRSKARPPKRG